MPVSQLADVGDNNEECKTFVFEQEGHTLGNALRCIISNYKDVEFCGYTVPHPSEDKMHFRIQMCKGGTAIDALKRGLKDLILVCEHTEKQFDEEFLSFSAKNGLNL
ncbi:PREDICTED: probable DNA-directed RNA polymerases I and III subunit RPAC2 [Nicrophorus vespilloides]|uniref:DNA-directed RNA polymerase I subunit D n=1 Tax=Nicrophorus vespilloides TaxID=110193 RepID=A0ABM1MLS7_NICVS|nr:PREDICTED: probable DNA-directed RNA polymerases I and III subunit RPAC2 [Nicrophorus vespilloides]